MKDVVVGTGEALWDVLPEGRKIGGAPANVAWDNILYTSHFEGHLHQRRRVSLKRKRLSNNQG